MLEIVPDTLYAVGGGLPDSLPVSWLTDGRVGWMPVQCYVFRGGGDAMVLDSGIGAHRRLVADGLAGLLHGAGRKRVLVGRWEPDAMVNLPSLIEAFGIREILSYGGINPLDFFEGFEAAVTHSVAQQAAGPAELVPIGPGDVIEVGRLRLEVLSPVLRLLLTTWYYERVTRSLFTADAFGLLANPDAPYPCIAHPEPGRLSPEILRENLVTKFDWLIGAHCDALVADLARLRDGFTIDRICPTFGAVIEGSDAVTAVFDAAIAALEMLARERPRRALAGFDWQRALSPPASVDPFDPGRRPATAGSAIGRAE
ncbi:MAG TPA: hypothetical protein VE567_01345 [Sphingomonas sp.]|nr:hypothetical protein [Sphingomonas sp.]